MVVTDALGKVTFGWIVAYVLWKIGGDRWVTEVPILNPGQLASWITWAVPLSLAIGWGMHTVTRRAAALDNSWAEVVGLLFAVGHFAWMIGALTWPH